jgi:hypothetical protein
MPRHPLSSLDTVLVARARQLLLDSIHARLVTPAQLISVANVANALARLPLATDAGVICISVIGPRHLHGEIETRFSWKVSVESEMIVLGCGGHFYRPSTGGDSFTTLYWESNPGETPDLRDYRDELRIVPNIEFLMDGLPDILTAPEGYRLTVEDENNPWLEEELDELEVEESEDDEPDDAEPVKEMARGGWSISPVDEIELRLAATVEANVVNGRQPAFACGIDQCGSCDCDLSQRGMLVDGRLKGQVMWGNFLHSLLFARMRGYRVGHWAVVRETANR